eukprot:COSAG02_NODE_2213_length_9490_cov_2.784155_9_plen_122_part_00
MAAENREATLAVSLETRMLTECQSLSGNVGASSSDQPIHGEKAVELLRQRVAELQHLATAAERARERAVAEACVLQQQRDFFHESTKEALKLVAQMTEKTRQPTASSELILAPPLSRSDSP